jgi:hypothetical protein
MEKKELRWLRIFAYVFSAVNVLLTLDPLFISWQPG